MGDALAEILGLDVEIQEGHQQSIQQTADHGISVSCMKDYRNRIKRMIVWIGENYADDYYPVGVVDVTDEQQADPRRHYYGKTHDLKYSGLNVEIIKAFLSTVKKKENGQFCSFTNIRKFHDAILFGATEAREVLPQTYYTEMDRFLASYKKETCKARKEGKLDEQDSDPITFVLYHLICTWAIATGNVFVWVWTTLQWNCMARSISIDPLGFHNFKTGVDSIKCTYDDSKTDKSGEKVSPKNLYSNPYDPKVCCFTSMGCWFAISKDSFNRNDKIFLGTAQGGAAAHRYCTQLSEMLQAYMAKVNEFVRPGHASVHGIRKGSAVHSTSGTTFPPSMVAVARRGEWSQGVMFDIYFQFAEPGDQYLGRILAGLDPNQHNFDVLPPHFKEGMDNEFVHEAMMRCYGPILEQHDEVHGVTSLLLLCLASVVHHSDYLREEIAKMPSHPFSLVPILNNDQLLNELKKLVTFESTNGMVATGVPPHINQSRMIHEVLEITRQMHHDQKKHFDELKEVVKKAIEENDIEAGNITMPSITKKLDEGFEDIMSRLTEALDERLGPQPPADSSAATEEAVAPGTLKLYSYSNRFYHVPQDWVFPSKPKLANAWDLWLLGQPALKSTDGTPTPIRPYRMLQPKMLQQSLANKLKLEWRPIMIMMEGAPGLVIPDDASEINSAFLTDSYKRGLEHVKSRASYIWSLQKSNINGWSIGEWCKHIKRSHILKHGNDEDKAHLAAATRHNQPHSHQRKRKTPHESSSDT